MAVGKAWNEGAKHEPPGSHFGKAVRRPHALTAPRSGSEPRWPAVEQRRLDGRADLAAAGRRHQPNAGFRAMRLLPTLIRPWMVVLLVAVVYLAAVVRSSGGDAFAFVRVGSRFDPGTPDGTMGYDGQFSYQIAVSPEASVPKLDVPSYRLQRILYPLLARLAAFGDREVIPWTLVIVNLAAMAGGVAATEAILVLRGQNRWYALAYGLNVGMLMSVRLDLTEPTAYLFVQLAALAWAKGRHQTSAVAFCLASFAKEVTLLIALGYLVGTAVSDGYRKATRWALVAILPFVVWQGVLALWLGSIGVGSGGAMSTPFEVLPLRAWWSVAGYDIAAFLMLSVFVVPLTLVPAAAGMLVSCQALARRFVHPSAIALLIQSAAFMFLPASNLLDPLGASRFSIGLIATFLVFGATRPHRRVLVYSQLWLLTLAFIPGDNLLPSG